MEQQLLLWFWWKFLYNINNIRLNIFNTPSRSYDRKVTTWNPHPLIRLLEATGNNRFVVPGNQQTADNSTLFQEGDSISSSLNMYNDETLGFNISFGKCTDEGVTITITKWST